MDKKKYKESIRQTHVIRNLIFGLVFGFSLIPLMGFIPAILCLTGLVFYRESWWKWIFLIPFLGHSVLIAYYIYDVLLKRGS